eukprot:EC124241.1.p1 GENE.EC124241.1~~EC124241.1.p1  ORF type:complete len:138 (+),score=0.08 EC124241.1:231-644(+)
MECSRAVFLVIVCASVVICTGASVKDRQCGTLDLNSPLTQHCFPHDGSHHFVCCVDITLPENPNSPHGNYNPLERVIKTASNSSSYSWCTCSEEICEQQLGGRVAWNMNGIGWKGFAPPPPNRRLHEAGGSGSSHLH